MCRACKPPVYLKEYGHLCAHYRVVHSMRNMPPVNSTWCEAPLGLLSRPTYDNVRPQEFVRTFHGVNRISPHQRAGLNTPVPSTSTQTTHESSAHSEAAHGPSNNEPRIPLISSEELQVMIDNAIKKQLSNAIDKCLPSLVQEVDRKVSHAVKEQVPSMVNKQLLDVASQWLGETSSPRTPTSGRSRIIKLRSIESSPIDIDSSKDSSKNRDTTPHTLATNLAAEADHLMSNLTTPVVMSKSDEDLMNIDIPSHPIVVQAEAIVSSDTDIQPATTNEILVSTNTVSDSVHASSDILIPSDSGTTLKDAETIKAVGTETSNITSVSSKELEGNFSISQFLSHSFLNHFLIFRC